MLFPVQGPSGSMTTAVKTLNPTRDEHVPCACGLRSHDNVRIIQGHEG